MAKPHYDVVCGIIENERHQVLVSLRSLESDNGGFWEFPGGKVELDESLNEALSRELKEELGIVVYEAEPWMQINHEYEKYHITLHVWCVTEYDEQPEGVEGQLLRWVDLETLPSLEFPPANDSIITALIKQYAIIH